MAIAALTPVVVSLGTTDTTILTVPAGETYRLDGILVVNTDSSAHTFRIHLYDGATGSPAQGNALYYDVTIPANETWSLPFGPLVLPAGWKLSGLADIAGMVNVIITGFTQS
ncbi:MAG TPA: hypothetical protein G4O02_13290 [Caldilineae bacterium]|nr:hypothetical protein [Caldilineae bacterium]